MSYENLNKIYYKPFLNLSEPEINYDFGQIWSLESGKLVVITEVDEDTVNVVPISVELENADNYSIILGQKESQLGFEFMILTDIENSVLKTELKNFVKGLSKEIKNNLQKMLLTQPAEKIKTGKKILSEIDSRLDFKEEEIKFFAKLTNNAFEFLQRNIIQLERIFIRQEGNFFRLEVKEVKILTEKLGESFLAAVRNDKKLPENLELSYQSKGKALFINFSETEKLEPFLEKLRFKLFSVEKLLDEKTWQNMKTQGLSLRKADKGLLKICFGNFEQDLELN
ncbi:hypothetical protein IT568_06655 [bacterium]|nr:hypothetical protein [bacterium]